MNIVFYQIIKVALIEQNKEKVKLFIFNNICLHNITMRKILQNRYNFVAKIHQKFHKIKLTHQVYQNIHKNQNNMYKVIRIVHRIEIYNLFSFNNANKINHVSKINQASKINHIDKINHQSNIRDIKRMN